MKKSWSSQITYCSSLECSSPCPRSFFSKAKRTILSRNSKDATLMSQSWRLSRPHLHRLYPVHEYHKQERQQRVPLWESSAHTEAAWCNAKNVNIALAPNALNGSQWHLPRRLQGTWLENFADTQNKLANSAIICEALCPRGQFPQHFFFLLCVFLAYPHSCKTPSGSRSEGVPRTYPSLP